MSLSAVVEGPFFANVAILSIVFNVIFTFLFLGRSTVAITPSLQLGVYYRLRYRHRWRSTSLIGTSAGEQPGCVDELHFAKVLPKVDNTKSLLLHYNNLNASFCSPLTAVKV
jgi:hypothetical protein